MAYFKFRTINRTTISLRLARSLDDLVDRPNPIELLKVKLVCGVEDVSVIIILSFIVIRRILFLRFMKTFLYFLIFYLTFDTSVKENLTIDY